jgi:ribonuclease HI
MVIIYTDGSCLKNPDGPGGWCAAIIESNHVWFLSGGDPCTTNNKMELQAVIEALEFCEDHKKCDIYSDSKYVINCAQNIWGRHKNIELWEKYDKVSQGKKIKWNWVKGHSGNEYNEKVDIIAREEAKAIQKI